MGWLASGIQSKSPAMQIHGFFELSTFGSRIGEAPEGIQGHFPEASPGIPKPVIKGRLAQNQSFEEIVPVQFEATIEIIGVVSGNQAFEVADVNRTVLSIDPQNIVLCQDQCITLFPDLRYRLAQVVTGPIFPHLAPEKSRQSFASVDSGPLDSKISHQGLNLLATEVHGLRVRPSGIERTQKPHPHRFFHCVLIIDTE